MGKSSPTKKATGSQPGGPLDPFLKPPATSDEQMEVQTKMAPAPEPGKPQCDQLSKHDLTAALASQRKNISEDFANFIAPLKVQIETILKELSHIAQTADAALEASIANNEDIRNLQAHEQWAKDEILTLKTKMRDRNLKFRGLEEQAEGNVELSSFLASWLATSLQLEDGVAPLILRAYRVGSPIAAKTKGPRDIIIELADFRTKRTIQELARRNGGIAYNESTILVFPDLPPESLALRRQLKPFAQKLHAAGIRYRWSPAGHLTLNFQGKHLEATDADLGMALLRALNLDLPPDFPERRPPKRKLDFPSSPSSSRWSKIPILRSVK